MHYSGITIGPGRPNYQNAKGIFMQSYATTYASIYNCKNVHDETGDVYLRDGHPPGQPLSVLLWISPWWPTAVEGAFRFMSPMKVVTMDK